jgi:hypothetical protein
MLHFGSVLWQITSRQTAVHVYRRYINYLLRRLLAHKQPCCTLWGGWLPHQLVQQHSCDWCDFFLGVQVSDRYQYVHRSSLSLSTIFNFLPLPVHVLFD